MPEILIRSWARTYRARFVEDFREHVRPLVDDGALVVASRTAWRLHGQGVPVPDGQLILVDASERLKSWEGVRDLIDRLSDMGFRSNQQLVAVGGGTVQDLVGFTAGIYHRGVTWSLVPTTLLAQCDSCIGSKSAINVGATKNVVGGFWPPAEVLIDGRLLATLPERDVRSGIGELMHFLVQGGSPLLFQLPEDYGALFEDRARLRPYIEESLRIKAAVVQRDEFDHGERNLLNYGHTFGHALESATDYAVPHGEAVAFGMDLANWLSVQLGMLDPVECARLRRAIQLAYPRLDLRGVDLDRFTAALARDRKNVAPGHVTCVLCRGHGDLFLHTLPLDAGFRDLLGRYIDERAAVEAVA